MLTILAQRCGPPANMAPLVFQYVPEPAVFSAVAAPPPAEQAIMEPPAVAELPTVVERQQGKSHERSFWQAWFHIAKWREQEVDALKEIKRRYSIADVKGCK